MNHSEKGNGLSVQGAALAAGAGAAEFLDPHGYYIVECTGPREEVRELYCALRDELNELKKSFRRFVPGMARKVKELQDAMTSMLEPKWADDIHNVVCTEGKNAAFTQLFKTGITGTPPLYMGLINNVTYTAPAATGLAANIASSASANSWNEAVAGTCAARQVPAFAAASAGAIALSTARTFSIVGTDSINGVFLLITSAAAVAPTATVAATAGALWSAGAFTGGIKAVLNGDTLNVSYSASM